MFQRQIEEASAMRRIAFFSGLILGSSVCAWILGFILIHLYTGKILALYHEWSEGELPIHVVWGTTFDIAG